MATNPAISNMRRQVERFRTERSGTPVKFRGVTLIAKTFHESGAKAGQTGIDRTGLRQYIANTDPTGFKFNHADFLPTTNRELPEVGEFILYLGWSYEITAISADVASEEAFSIRVYGLKKIYAG